MKQSLQLKLSQHLALTPQLQQSIRLLQLSTIEFNQEIERFLDENPMLERDEPDATASFQPPPESVTEVRDAPQESTQASADERAPEGTGSADMDEWSGEGGNYGTRSGGDDDDGDYQDVQAAGTSLRDHLCGQLALSQMSERDRYLIRLLIEALDDDGYLNQGLDELVELLPEEADIDLDDLSIALRQLQNFDPPGVAARDPRECLLMQLNFLPTDEVSTLARVIIDQHIDLLAARDFAKIRRAVGCDEELLRAAQSLIRSLNPRPGAQFAPIDARYIVPDVVVRKVRGQWTALLNPDAMPRLRINRLYAEILQGQRGSGLSGQLQEAKWLIKNVQQRFDTILRVSQAIVERQRQFFEFGEVAMRPLTLREIAETLELHESTISRVTSQKYMATTRGLFELKYFFGSHVATESGGACSATAIRALIRQLVAAEDAKRPLSDSRIAEILGQQGIVVARRTIAKYRESLNIPPVSVRKAI
ncbi:MAG: RNA polymerase factor sigma-54 [Pseudomonadota bacterium]|uniref:RNA polymerase factor sigma-54 n=1 Tax=Methyloversatilis sp. TaxID=2569862 RepID=UPI002735F736|nr:RNA polymerase factor sigma-54 [Methyloversatilis sp.]MDP3871797.1 RNA polymerase factor sigma-54 [Methyloversatilis sp.]